MSMLGTLENIQQAPTVYRQGGVLLFLFCFFCFVQGFTTVSQLGSHESPEY